MAVKQKVSEQEAIEAEVERVRILMGRLKELIEGVEQFEAWLDMEDMYVVYICEDETAYGFVNEDDAKIVIYDFMEHNKLESRTQVCSRATKIKVCHDLQDFQEYRMQSLANRGIARMTPEEIEAVKEIG